MRSNRLLENLTQPNRPKMYLDGSEDAALTLVAVLALGVRPVVAGRAVAIGEPQGRHARAVVLAGLERLVLAPVGVRLALASGAQAAGNPAVAARVRPRLVRVPATAVVAFRPADVADGARGHRKTANHQHRCERPHSTSFSRALRTLFRL